MGIDSGRTLFVGLIPQQERVEDECLDTHSGISWLLVCSYAGDWYWEMNKLSAKKERVSPNQERLREAAGGLCFNNIMEVQ